MCYADLDFDRVTLADLREAWQIEPEVTVMKCEDCGADLHVGDYPFCHGDATKHVPSATSAIGDDIPGGVEIKHGICNEDGTPRRYYSKSEMRKEAARRGMVNKVQHIPSPGSDKNRGRHTQRWI